MIVIVVLAVAALLYIAYLWKTGTSRSRTHGVVGFVLGAFVGGGVGVAGGGGAVSGVFVVPFVFLLIGLLMGRR